MEESKQFHELQLSSRLVQLIQQGATLVGWNEIKKKKKQPHARWLYKQTLCTETQVSWDLFDCDSHVKCQCVTWLTASQAEGHGAAETERKRE